MKRILIIILILAIAYVANAESITLGWLANTDALDGYNVYQQQEAGGFVLLDYVPCTANDPVCCEYTTQPLLWSTSYFWFVTAFGPGGESGSSNTVAHTVGPEPVSPPNNPVGCFIKSINQ